jgi:hypothetical protein
MSLESDMRQRVIKALRSLDAVSIENCVGNGTPDVNYIGGWLELKSRDEWPKRASTPVRIEHFTPDQRVWLRRRRHRGGDVRMLLKVANDWLLIDGVDAAKHVGEATKEELFSIAEKVWENGLNEAELLECLRKP